MSTVDSMYQFAVSCVFVFFFQAEDGIRDLVRSRGLGDVYKRQMTSRVSCSIRLSQAFMRAVGFSVRK